MIFMQDRRSEIRMLCADMVEVRWCDHFAKARRTMALLEDISTSGACLQMDSALPAGTRIRWKCSNQQFKGVVRYCAYQEIGYFVGVEFDAGSQWSKQQFEPQHFLDMGRFLDDARNHTS